ncbi:mannose-6-phosphate isomerase, class I [Virgibacillus sp. SK37]|uniref:mannose-6-phosphate isomerase, class I n=1 Tax=Virgibacillus sp. SK37 TaxID=403957 RepID=UPI0004D10C06|nr:mannose-6-phosphate isomerase, class I [Virgibacillus sp. SK37]AIF44572.1 mannose-6-phosphate isomerase [Virgibacillus sp. SK37]
MKNDAIFLEPFFQERIWGGQRLRQLFDYQIPSTKTGEAWTISAHPTGPSVVKNGQWKGKTLQQLWQEYPELFGKNSSSGHFPLLVKLIDSNDDLSVQVHPDDFYAREQAGEPNGKTECWYVVHAEEDAEIVLGHHAQSKAEFSEMVGSGAWEQLLRKVKVKQGDFFYVPSGTLHAIGKGIVILEIQQNSDITYRVYDYDRKDVNGKARPLHLDEAMNITRLPHMDTTQEVIFQQQEVFQLTRFIEGDYFTVEHWKVMGKVDLSMKKTYLLCSVIAGEGKLVMENTYDLRKGDHFILPAGNADYRLYGEMELVVASEGRGSRG